ncbi:MAG: magnesium transporter [Thermomicrobiales bacterium]|nr:magnesium transporter [Thermomicrobiales bacterium]
MLRLRDLLLNPPARRIADILIREPLSVRAEAPLEELEHLFNQHSFVGVPVVDAGGRLMGVVQRAATRRAAERRAGRMLLSFSGIVGGEELRSMSLARRASRRLSWLSINILLNLVAASVIAVYQDVLTSVIALAVFLPVISDMSGCSGNQAVAVSMRELTAGLVQPRELLRVLGKEASLGLLNGLVLGVLLAIVTGDSIKDIADPLGEIPGAILSGKASGVIDLAILWFMATPVVTVIAVALGFLRLGDRRYALLSLIVLVILGASIALSLLR